MWNEPWAMRESGYSKLKPLTFSIVEILGLIKQFPNLQNLWFLFRSEDNKHQEFHIYHEYTIIDWPWPPSKRPSQKQQAIDIPAGLSCFVIMACKVASGRYWIDG